MSFGVIKQNKKMLKDTKIQKQTAKIDQINYKYL